MRSHAPARAGSDRRLPPGQWAVKGFPRFGRRPGQPPPPVPTRPTLRITGPLEEPIVLDLAELEQLPRVRLEADFHCVSGWTATDLTWEGVSFAELYRRVVQPRVRPDREITHAVLCGLDGYRVVVWLDDLLDAEVLVATRLDGAALSRAHGAPARLVSPLQYGFVSVKHLCAIELHTHEPRRERPLAVVTRGHLRGRVWREERHAWFPAWVVRPLYRGLVRVVASAARRRGTRGAEQWRRA